MAGFIWRLWAGFFATNSKDIKPTQIILYVPFWCIVVSWKLPSLGYNKQLFISPIMVVLVFRDYDVGFMYENYTQLRTAKRHEH
jgi:hypothetical protein